MSKSMFAPFRAVFQTEVLLNSKRIVPYALMVLFAANAVLWWGWGPAIALGWATNSDYYIVRNYIGFAFILGLPIFNAVIMGDPVIRDFRYGIDPLIFSKPVTRTQYVLGKFLGNFFVLVCCQSVFAFTLLILQAFRTSQMVMQPVRVWPYFKHFIFFVALSHLVIAAVYFTAGTLTRNSKIVYVLAVCFYPIYITYSIVLSKLPHGKLFDPLLPGTGPGGGGFLSSAEYLNQLVVTYSADMIANRVLMILITVGLLALVYFRFTICERRRRVEDFSRLNLSTAGERVYYQPVELGWREPEKIALPLVTKLNNRFTASVKKLIAATGVEFRLLCAERSLVVLVPLVIGLSTLELAFYNVVADLSYSVTYASRTANALLLFLVGICVFYVGEAMHRDREVRIEAMIWATPVKNFTLLWSKFLSTLMLTLSVVLVVGLIAIGIQVVRGHYPIDIQAYVWVYSVVLVPGLIFLSAASVALNILLRDKYLTYAVSIGIGAGAFYLYSIGYNHWVYNPLLYRLWSYGELYSETILAYRVYCLAITFILLALAHIFFRRRRA